MLVTGITRIAGDPFSFADGRTAECAAKPPRFFLIASPAGKRYKGIAVVRQIQSTPAPKEYAMRKLLIVAILAVPTILITPDLTFAGHCCHPCGRGCFHGGCFHGGCFHGGCFHGGCFHGPFCGHGCVSIGFYPAFYWPAYYYSYAPYAYYPSTVTVPYPAYVVSAPALPVNGSGNGSDLRVAPQRPPQAPAAPDATPAPSRATVVVVLPAEARLLANGQPLATTSDHRTFATPELTPGKSFQYTFTAEMIRDGKLVSQTKKVQVRAGEETQLAFEFPSAVASKK
jgi:uncharacterized protein (TIGR03000 family)